MIIDFSAGDEVEKQDNISVFGVATRTIYSFFNKFASCFAALNSFACNKTRMAFYLHHHSIACKRERLA
jgi:hypothetical protein